MKNINVSEVGWNGIYSLKAPLKIATAEFNKLTEYFHQGIPNYFSDLVAAKPVSFNTSYLGQYAGNTQKFGSLISGLNGIYTAPEFYRLYLAAPESVVIDGGSGLSRGMTATDKTTLQDLVFHVTFYKLKDYMEIVNSPHVAEVFLATSFNGNGAAMNSTPFIKVNVGDDGNYTLYEELKDTYGEWYLPFITPYILNAGASLPRQAENGIPPVVFVPFASNIIHWVNKEVTNLYANKYANFTYPMFFCISAAYITNYYYTSNVGYTNIMPYEAESFRYTEILGNGTFTPLGKAITPYKTVAVFNQGYISYFNTRGYPPLAFQPFANCKIIRGEGGLFNIQHIFETKEDALNYYRDFGITITEDIETAKNLPTEDITPPTGNTDPPVTEIPSYPDDTSDIIDITTPDYTASSFGQCKIYTPLTTEPLIKWFGENTFWQDINRLFANPMDAVFGLRLYNLDLVMRDTGHTAANTNTTILNVSTDIACYSLLNGYNTIVNGGTYQYTAYYGNFADFLNATYDIFIPYVGIRRLNPSDVVNRLLELKYAVDFATGDAAVFLLSDSKLIMTTSCNISAEIPIQTSNINDVNFKTLMGVLTGAVSGGKSGFVSGAKTGNIAGAIGGTVGGAVVGGALSGLENYLNNIEHGYQGSVSGNNSYAMVEPFLIIRRYPIANVGAYPNLYGLKNASTVTFSSLTNGYIQADTVEINTRATDRERDEIVALLKSGIHVK